MQKLQTNMHLFIHSFILFRQKNSNKSKQKLDIANIKYVRRVRKKEATVFYA